MYPLTNEFLDSLSSHYFLSHILQPTMADSNFKIFIDKVFSNMTLPNTMSGNLTATLSDHHPQFFIAPNIFLNFFFPRFNKYERDFQRFDQENFILDYFSIDWNNLLLASYMNVENLYKTFTRKFNSLLNFYASQKKSLKIN